MPFNLPQAAEGGKLVALELLRVLSSASVLLVHYSHFKFLKASRAFDRTKQPLYDVLRPVYTDGGDGIYVFWAISGFIFFKTYKDSIASGATSFRDFCVRRFSRLYPLHFATLVLVAVLQLAYTRLRSEPFVFTNNNLTQFVLNLVMLNGWGPAPWAFNAHFWSVSVELVVYAMFYGVTRMFGTAHANKGACAFLAASVALRAAQVPLENYMRVLDCACMFYAGGALCMIFALMDGHTQKVACLNLQKTARAAVWVQKCADITYATYMMQFPIQIVLALCFPLETAAESDRLLFCLYVGVVPVCAHFVYTYYEMPAQTYLRAKLAAAPKVQPEEETKLVGMIVVIK